MTVPSLPQLPRLPLVPDPLRRIHIPPELEPITSIADEADPEPLGIPRETIEHIWAGAVDLYRSGVHPALTLCLRRHGQVVLDRAIGHARGNGPDDRPDTPKILATPETPFCVYSSSKAFTAMVVHRLVEEGALALDDRIAHYIPDYAQHGKADTTIGHVLSHRAGVPTLPPELFDLDRIGDRELMSAAIADSKPFVKPGSRLAYHAVSGGFVIAEVIYRATGQSVRDVLRERILEPLGFRWSNYGVSGGEVPAVGRSYTTGPRLLPPLSTLSRRVLGAPIAEVVELSNDPRFLTAIVPSANIVTTAHELSRFFEIFRCGGELDGVRVMAPETLRTALTEQSRLEIDLSLVFPTRFSYGLMLGAKLLSLYGRDTDLAFGHLGLINIMGWADPERGISGGLITSGKALVYPEVHRFYGLMQRIASEVPKVPAFERPF
jgi:CubicO group peptidase (beta-lactamase class C family)